MSAAAEHIKAPALEWLEPGMPAYHIESKCGRYTVSRVTQSASGTVHYIAWRVTRGQNNRIVSRRELDSLPVPINAADERHKDARGRMRQRCAEDAASGVTA